MQIVSRLEEARALDGVSDTLQKAISAAVRPQRVRDLLHGTWLGHPLHPGLVQLPIGAFVSSAILDLLPGRRRSSTVLVAVGVASSVPAIAAGWTDWSEMTHARRRVGLVHAASNAVLVGLCTASLVARLRGRSGKALSYAGISVGSVAAYLGGHLAYAQSGGVNQAAPELGRIPEEWTEVGPLASFSDGKPAVRSVGDVSVLFYRAGDRLTAMIERCGHETGPLGEGEVVGVGSETCVVCPWHGSTFRLSDGRVIHGPAGSDQPTLEVRVADGAVSVRQP
ncbi:Rieske 2Fe-2S domain-containing protein [Actinoplanes sp. TBRC 11911]|uniref:Rieske 2Fe-2S domain-containing protein n=1 Tax=Actinoplanes sp. TBRC 11911 TaxID=2729386 RepID=UPI00145DE683|nr:Rieske 2Fe-2S domain-containing protein [Actinoplanes sp. TBRC 11911]NMO57517.1 Rieske 2Fe-2S domain-containing protein [Actinoplanes sp. TBRC 11911]